jgi:GNAT superfamily N-acetyltransferase
MIASYRMAERTRSAERARLASSMLTDGRRFTIRPIERGEAGRLKALFGRLTPDSRYRRYLSPKAELTEKDLERLLDIDHFHHVALAAVDEHDGSFLAAARYVESTERPDHVEMAIEVADDLHRQGIGTALAIQTLERARGNGFTRATATTLQDNIAARCLLRRLQFRLRSSDGIEIEFELELKVRGASKNKRTLQ